MLAISDQTHVGTHYLCSNRPEPIFYWKQSIAKLQRCHRWVPSSILGWYRKLIFGRGCRLWKLTVSTSRKFDYVRTSISIVHNVHNFKKSVQ